MCVAQEALEQESSNQWSKQAMNIASYECLKLECIELCMNTIEDGVMCLRAVSRYLYT